MALPRLEAPETPGRAISAAADAFRRWSEEARREATAKLAPDVRRQFGQFLTPLPVADFLASLFEARHPEVSLLDAGAGAGTLSAAFVAALCSRPTPPRVLRLVAYEVDPILAGFLDRTLRRCRTFARQAGTEVHIRIEPRDFLDAAARGLTADLFGGGEAERFTCAILNPPYRKIRTESRERQILRGTGLEATNLYPGFLALAGRLLEPGGEMVAITPRSFCNGPYFEPFRRSFLDFMRFTRIHVFDARDRAFADDEVLQENIVFRAVREPAREGPIEVSASVGPGTEGLRSRSVPVREIIRPEDPRRVIHVVTDAMEAAVRARMSAFGTSLADLGLQVSTGRVVGFRARDLLRARSGPDTVPLIHPCHLRGGRVQWPREGGRKPEALADLPEARDLLVPAGMYVLTKRFTSKEERRRIVAAVYNPDAMPGGPVAFENHLNYIHADGSGLPPILARGLAAYLNSGLVDSYFRQFSGHTQVNAADLRSLPYPDRAALIALGRRVGPRLPPADEIDPMLDAVVERG